MGAGQSAPKGNIGLHVLRVAEGSPAADSQIEPYFDFVVGYNGTPTVCLPAESSVMSTKQS